MHHLPNPYQCFFISTLLLSSSLSAVQAQAQPAQQSTSRSNIIQRNVLPPSAFAKAPLQEIQFVDAFVLPQMNNAKLLVAAKTLDGSGPLHFAEPVALGLDCHSFGTWETYSATEDIWRAVFSSPGAVSLNIGFSEYSLPEGANLTLYTGAGDELVGPFTADQNEEHGQFWTPILEGDQITLELIVPRTKRSAVQLKIGQVNHGFRSFKPAAKATASAAKSGACNVDIACEEGDDWRDQASAVGGYSFGGSIFCTGTLINNTAQDVTPYFLTANHCGLNAANAPSVVVYWNYENSTCRAVNSGASGSAGDGQLNQFSSGAILRAADSTSDFTLLELDDPIPTDFGLFFAGWDNRPINTNGSVAIHHPEGDEKRISFDNHPTQITQYLSSTVVANGSYLRVTDWDLGTTEPGSSGSALFNLDKRIVGQLHGGFAACGNDLSDWYGRFALSWEGRGTPTTSLRPWLDPLNTGSEVFDGRFVRDIQLAENLVFDDSISGDADEYPEPGESLISFFPAINNQSQAAISNIQFQLVSTNEHVTIDQSFASLGSLGVAESGSTENALVFSISPQLSCSGQVVLQLRVSYDVEGTTRERVFPVPLIFDEPCDVVPELLLNGTTLEDSQGNGNNNGFADIAESPIRLGVSLRNVGADLTESAQVRLTSNSNSIILIRDSTILTPLAQGNTAEPIIPFLVGISPSAVEGVAIPLELEILAGENLITIPFNITPGEFIPQSATYFLGSGKTYGDTGLPSEVREIFPVGMEGFVTSVELTVDISHTYVGDNVLTLSSPSGKQVVLFNRNGGSANNFTNTVFTDSAASSIVEGFAPFTGRFRPIEPLAGFVNETSFGNWEFIANDVISQDSGTVNTLSLLLNINQPTSQEALSLELNIPDPQTNNNLIETGETLDLGRMSLNDSAPFQFLIENTGEGDLYIYSLSLPTGLTINQALPIVISPVQARQILILPITSGTPGNYTGEIRLQTNDPDNLNVSIPVVFSLGEPILNRDFWIFD